MMNALTNLGVGIAIAFVYSWVLTLTALAFVPFVAAGGYIELKFFSGAGSKKKGLFEEAVKVCI